MKFFQFIFYIFSTENESFTNIIIAPLAIIEATVATLLFTTILNIKCSKKAKFFYIISVSSLGIICNSIFLKQYSNVITLICTPFIIMYIFKTSFLKSIVAEFLPLICISLLETLISRFFLSFFNIPFELSANIPIYRLLTLCFIYSVIFLIYKIVKHFNLNINILENISKSDKRIIILNVTFAIICIGTQFFLIMLYNDYLPSFIIFLSIISLFTYFFISLYGLTRTMKLEIATTDLQEAQLYNRTLELLYDNTRSFKHDLGNILDGIEGYVERGDLEGFKKYYYQLSADYKHTNNLTALNPKIVNNPAIYNVLVGKYHKADQQGIKITLEVSMNLNQLYMEIYEFSRVLGILMDNAIEAASECKEKRIYIYFKEKANLQFLIIRNSYIDTNIDTKKIYQKNFSTKKDNTGLGLWKVIHIVNKHNNLVIRSCKDDYFFTQRFEIYY